MAFFMILVVFNNFLEENFFQRQEKFCLKIDFFNNIYFFQLIDFCFLNLYFKIKNLSFQFSKILIATALI